MKELVLIAGTPGTRRKTAVERMVGSLAGKTIATVDLERKLVGVAARLMEEDSALGEFIRSFGTKKQGTEAKAPPNIQRITWRLAQDVVAKLWDLALEDALSELSDADADLCVLSAHLVYYRGETHEFYSPLSGNLPKRLNEAGLEPKRVFVLIEDTYDMYDRLTREGEVFDFLRQLDGEYAGKPKPDDRAVRYQIALGLVVRTLLRLLTWREKEILAAEVLAKSLGARAFVLAVKHPVHVGAAILTGECTAPGSLLTYMSHTISRPRRHHKEHGDWPEFVTEFHEFTAALYRSPHPQRCFAVMPTAIDEYRILEDDNKHRIPVLGARWPLFSRTAGALLYHLEAPYESYEDYEREKIQGIFNPPIDTDGTRFGEPGANFWEGLAPEIRFKVAGHLEALLLATTLQMSNRDHLLVRQCPGFLLYRPVYQKGGFSRGVGAELQNWSNMRKGLQAFGDPAHRPLLFFHADEDLDGLQVSRENLLYLGDRLRGRIKELTGIDVPKAPVDVRADGWFNSFLTVAESELSSGPLSPEARKVIGGERERLEAEVADWWTALLKGIQTAHMSRFGSICRRQRFDLTLKPNTQAERQTYWDGIASGGMEGWIP